MSATDPATRIGIDLVDVDRIERSLATFGARFTGRLFTSSELRDCTVDGRLHVPALAARFAAKEAAIKAFDLAEAGVGWAQLEVEAAPADAPRAARRMVLHGRAAESAAAAGPCEIAVTLSHEGGLACAMVVARCVPTNNESRMYP